MKVDEVDSYVLDCSNIYSEDGFWSLYLETVKPEGSEYFGRNLPAFRDAITAGGPGWPGVCQIELINVENIQTFPGGKFYLELQTMALKLKRDNLSAGIILKIPAD